MSPLRGDLVRLRARHEADVPILDQELHDDDVVTAVRGSGSAWRPIPRGSKASDYRVREPNDTDASFSVVELATDSLAGEISLWQIDTYNRWAHIGMALRPAYRGKGLGAEALRLACDYGFRVLGLHRLQVETLADNTAMLRTAERLGFRRELVHREHAWILGGFLDQVVLGLLADEHRNHASG